MIASEDAAAAVATTPARLDLWAWLRALGDDDQITDNARGFALTLWSAGLLHLNRARVTLWLDGAPLTPSMRRLARVLGRPFKTIARRVKELRQGGYLKGWRCVVGGSAPTHPALPAPNPSPEPRPVSEQAHPFEPNTPYTPSRPVPVELPGECVASDTNPPNGPLPTPSKRVASDTPPAPPYKEVFDLDPLDRSSEVDPQSGESSGGGGQAGEVASSSDRAKGDRLGLKGQVSKLLETIPAKYRLTLPDDREVRDEPLEESWCVERWREITGVPIDEWSPTSSPWGALGRRWIAVSRACLSRDEWLNVCNAAALTAQKNDHAGLSYLTRVATREILRTEQTEQSHQIRAIARECAAEAEREHEQQAQGPAGGDMRAKLAALRASMERVERG